MPSVRQERLQHVRELHRWILSIVCGVRAGGTVTIDGERKHYYELMVRDLLIIVMRAFPIDSASTAQRSILKASFEGKTMLHVRWSTEAYDIVTYRPGEWEGRLIRR